MGDEIENLSKETQSLERLSDILGYLNIGFVVSAALVTIATFFISDKLAKAKEKIADLRITNANERISIANREIENSKVIVATANEKAEKASLDAEEAKNKQSLLEIDMINAKARQAQAEEKQAIAQAELAKLNQKIAPRIISEHQIRTIKNVIDKYKNNRITIAYVAGDSESEQLAVQFDKLFKSAGWITNVGSLQSLRSPEGISVMVNNVQSSPFAEPLLIAIRTFDPTAQGTIESSMDHAITLLVGIKRKKED